MKQGRFKADETMIGKYINQKFGSDIEPLGKIVKIISAQKVEIQPVKAGPNKTKMEVALGGFVGHTVNNKAQSYDFIEYGEVETIRLNKTVMKRMGYYIADAPRKHYDYNF